MDPVAITEMLREGGPWALVGLLTTAVVALWIFNNNLQKEWRADIKQGTERLVEAAKVLEQAIELTKEFVAKRGQR